MVFAIYWHESAILPHFLLLFMSLGIPVCVSCSVSSNSLWPHGQQPTRLLCLWDSPGKNTGVGCQFLLQGIFPTQGLNPGFPHCRQILYQLSHRGSPIALCILYIFCFSLWFIFSPKSQFSFLLSFSICSVMSDFQSSPLFISPRDIYLGLPWWLR